MKVLAAPWVITGDAGREPIRDGAVALGPDEAVAAVGTQAELGHLRDRGAAWQEHAAVLLPGLVNAHTHLELSALRGKVARSGGFGAWAAEMIARRTDLAPERDVAALEDAVAELRTAGTAAIGEVTNTLASHRVLGASPMLVRFFVEVFGLRRDAAGVMVEMAREATREAEPRSAAHSFTLAPHTLFSLHPDSVREIVAEARAAGARTSLHLAEHAGERMYLGNGTGPIADFFRARGADASDWEPPGLDPISYAERLGILGPSLCAVHLADARPPELARFAASGARAVLCPRSNLYIEGRPPPLPAILAAGIRPGLGTDSLASNDDLDVLREAAELCATFPDVPPRLLLAMATSWGAEAIDVAHRAGTLAAGRQPGLVAVDLAGPIPDEPERWLLADVTRPRRWLAGVAPTIAREAA